MTTWRLFPEKLGNTSATTFVGDAGEVFYDPTSTTLRISDGSTPGGLTIGGGGGLQAEADTLQTVSTRGATSTNQLTMAGFITTAGSTVGGHLIPDTNVTYDLGSAEYKFRHLYLSSNTIYVGENDDTISVLDSGNGPELHVNNEPMRQIINNNTTVQNIQNGSGWQLMGPYVNEGEAATAGVQIGQAYYDNGGTVRVRLA